MASYVKYNVFVRDLVDGVHDFSNTGGDTFRCALTNTTPVATHATLSQVTELGTSGGYTVNGIVISPTTVTLTTDTAKVTHTTDPVWTGSGAGFTFSHAILFNDSTAEGPVDPLIASWAYGSSQLVGLGETLTVDFDSTNGLFTIV
jgi:hypothetical protein